MSSGDSGIGSCSSSQSEGTSSKLKLSLKRSNSDSTQSTLSSKIINCSENDASQANSYKKSISEGENVSKEPDVEDSLADFKSPKEDKKVSKPILSKFKFERDKVKKKLVKSKSKSSKSIKSVVSAKQPSIESSFFKPQTSNQTEAREAFLCPLCLKPFKDEVTQTNHMKTCAAKNNVSVQQLLDAKKLQERQAEERKAMGLQAAPVIPEKKKSFRSKNYSTGEDAQLQLVLAMSESLYEAERKQEFEQAAVLAGIPSECLKDINAEERKTLQGFGFSSNKPVIDVPVRQIKKRKLYGPTILQSRSKEDKDRVLTERIACIITGDDALTQSQQSVVAHREKTPTTLRSQKLRDIERLDNKLWDISRLTKSLNNFYVEELKALLMGIDRKPIDVDVAAATATGPPVISETEVHGDDNNANGTLADISIEYEPVDIDLLVNQNEESHVLEVNETEVEMDSEFDFVKKAISNWANTLNKSTKSDLLIFVTNNKKIYAHSLVLFVQCPIILQDKVENDSIKDARIKDKINWLTKNQQSALAFLEFIYCGCISKYVDVFKKVDLLNEVKSLANQYKVSTLLDYIKLKQDELKSKRNERVKVAPAKQRESPTHSPQPQPPPPPPPKKTISFDKYKQTQGLPAESNVKSSKTLRSRGTQTEILESDVTAPVVQDTRTELDTSILPVEHDTRTESDTSILPVKHDKKTESEASVPPVEHNKKTESEASVPPVEHNKKTESGASVPPVEHDKKTGSETSVPPVESIMNTPTGSLKSILKNGNRKRFTNSPEITFDSFDESMYTKATQRSQTEQSQNSGNINMLVDLINQEENDDQTSALTQKSVTNENPVPPASKPSTSPAMNSSSPRSKVESEVINIESDDDEEIDREALYQAITPPRRRSSPPRDHRAETELDLFLKKVQKANAKDVMDTDSECDVSFTEPGRRNPFLTRNRDDSYRYLRNDGRTPKNRKVISMLERDISKDEKLQNAKDQTSDQSASTSRGVNISVNEGVTGEADDLQILDQILAHAPQILAVRNTVLDDPQLEDSANDTTLKKKANDTVDDTVDHATSNPDIHDVPTDDESEISMYSRYKRNNQHHNSIQKYRRQLNVESLKNFARQKNDSRESNNNTSSGKVIEDVTLVSDSDDESTNTRDSVPQNKSLHKSNSSLPENVSLNCSSNLHQSRIENASISNLDIVEEQISKIMNSPKEANDENFVDLSSDSEAENLDKKRKDSSTRNNSQRHKSFQESFINFDKNRANEDLDELRSKNSSKDKNNESASPANPNKNDDVDLGSLDNEWFNDLDNDNWAVESRTEHVKSPVPASKSISTSKKDFSELDSPASPPPYENAPAKDFGEFQSPESPPASPPENVRTLLSSSPVLSQNRKKAQAVRKLQTKSASTSNFETPPKKKTVPRSREYEDALKNLSSCPTPDLHKEMKKFGLKPQNGKNSRLLLNHIYTEMSKKEQKSDSKKRNFSEDSSEDEPPLKKQNVEGKSKKDLPKQKSKLQKASSSEDLANVAEEMECDERGSAFNTEDLGTIKIAFYKLMKTNSKLYNKVLTYEPLPFEFLHSTLKEKGLKCKKNSLMDFLDEQGITFQMETGKNVDRKKKKK